MLEIKIRNNSEYMNGNSGNKIINIVSDKQIFRRMAVLMLACITVFLSLGLSSCGLFEVMEMPTDSIDSTSNPVSGNENLVPAKGGTLTIAATKYDTLNPITTNNYYMQEILGLIYDGLVYINSNMQAVPLLAQSLECSADGITWTIKLKENITWHDGKYFSTDDVEYTLGLIMANTSNKYYHNVENIETVTVESAYTLVIKCKKPDSFLNEKLFFPIVPKHVQIDSNPVGSGLYKFISVNDQEMNLEAYSNNAQKVEKAVPYITNVQVKFYAANSDALYSDNDIIMLKYEDYSKVEGKVGYSVKKYLSTNFEVIAVNTTREKLALSSVRRAIAYAVDRKGAADSISYSKVVINDVPLFPESWLSPLSMLTYTYNPEEVKNLLKSANYETMELELLINKDDAEKKRYAEYYKAALLKVGITVTIVEGTAEEVSAKLQNKEYDIALVDINISMPDDLRLFYGTGGANNITGYSNKDLDVLFDKLSVFTYENERKTVYSAIEKTLLADVPYIGLFYKQNYILYNDKRVHYIEEAKPNYIKKLSDIEKWYINTEVQGQEGAQ